MAAQNNLCAICGQPFIHASGKEARRAFRPSLDHITPVAWGGSDEDDNFRVAHTICNQYRGHGENWALLAVLEQAKKEPIAVVYLLRDQRRRRRLKGKLDGLREWNHAAEQL